MSEISRLSSVAPSRFTMPPALLNSSHTVATQEPQEAYTPSPPTLPVSRTAGEVGPSQASSTTGQKVAMTMAGLATVAGLAGGLMPMLAPHLSPAPDQVQVQPQTQEDPALTAPSLLAQLQEAPVELPPPTEAGAAAVVSARDQSLLGEGRILKVDHYPGLHSSRLQSTKDPQPRIEGAPNFRKVNGSDIYGTAQPTVSGLREVLTRLDAGPGGEGPTVTWTTLREEPVVYIDGRSVTLRELATPFANLEQPGITAGDVEAQETRLKSEILKEAERFGGRLLIHDEQPDGKVVARWVEVSPDNLQTPAEVFKQMQNEGFRVDYARIPITDEQAPEDKDVDALVERLRHANPDSPLVFNCHAGRGRTTTGMVIGDLVRQAQNPATRLTANQGVRQDIREQGQYSRGEYKIILSLIKAMENGPQTKAEADAVIDRSAALQNLREAIEPLKETAESGQGERSTHARDRGRDYLYRYIKLISVNAYLREQAPLGFPQTFSEWKAEHPEHNVTRENLELALNLNPAQNSGVAAA